MTQDTERTDVVNTPQLPAPPPQSHSHTIVWLAAILALIAVIGAYAYSYYKVKKPLAESMDKQADKIKSMDSAITVHSNRINDVPKEVEAQMKKLETKLFKGLDAKFDSFRKVLDVRLKKLKKNILDFVPDVVLGMVDSGKLWLGLCYDQNRNNKCDLPQEDLDGNGVCDMNDCCIFCMTMVEKNTEVVKKVKKKKKDKKKCKKGKCITKGGKKGGGNKKGGGDHKRPGIFKLRAPAIVYLESDMETSSGKHNAKTLVVIPKKSQDFEVIHKVIDNVN